MKYSAYDRVRETDKNIAFLAGRFSKVGTDGKKVIVGTVGALWPHDLTRGQAAFIGCFYGIPNGEMNILPTYLPIKFPASNYTGFVIFNQEEKEA